MARKKVIKGWGSEADRSIDGNKIVMSIAKEQARDTFCIIRKVVAEVAASIIWSWRRNTSSIFTGNVQLPHCRKHCKKKYTS
jgi:hypothetical protein